MLIKPLSNGWDACEAYKLTLLQAINDKKKYRDEFNNLTPEEQIQWAVIHAKMEILDTFEVVR